MYSYVLFFCVFYLHLAFSDPYFHSHSSPSFSRGAHSRWDFWSALLHFLPSTIRLLLHEDRLFEPEIPRCSRRFCLLRPCICLQKNVLELLRS